jgi:hypothetical protein
MFNRQSCKRKLAAAALKPTDGILSAEFEREKYLSNYAETVKSS